MASVLVIGRQADLQAHLERILVPGGHSVDTVSSISEGISYCGTTPCDLVVVEDHVAAEVPSSVASLRATEAAPQVVVVTEQCDPKLGESALLGGALNYMRKGTAPRAINALLERMLAKPSDGTAPPSLADFGIYGSSPQMQAQFDMIYRSRAADVSVLIQGETGTGKELFAKAIHRMSSRKDGPLVTVDCASLPEHLVESLLFGYSQGAFTGAARSRVGLIKQADGGTLFLDEVGELPLSLQKKFLRVLQERRYRPVGGGQEETSNFRLIAATNRDLQEMTQQGMFRDDLLYRIRTLKIVLPPLRDRGGDIIEIAERLLEARCGTPGGRVREMSAEFRARLLAHDWPGNIRELVNVIDSTLAVAQDEDILFAEHLPATTHAGMIQASCMLWQQGGGAPREVWGEHSGAEGYGEPAERGKCAYDNEANSTRDDEGRRRPDRSAQPAQPGSHPLSLPSFREGRREALEMFERTYLAKLHSTARGDIRQACALSNLSRARVYELFRKYGIMR